MYTAGCKRLGECSVITKKKQKKPNCAHIRQMETEELLTAVINKIMGVGGLKKTTVSVSVKFNF